MSGILSVCHDRICRGCRPVLQAGRVLFRPGATVGLVGANGAGKSTWMMAVAGLLGHVGSGVRVHHNGRPVRRIGYVPQEPSFPAWLSAAEACELYGTSAERLIRTFPDLGLDRLMANRPDALSVGQRQLLASALALQARAPLYLLDEPLSALDIGRRRQLMNVFRREGWRADDSVVVISSQVASDLYEACDWLVVLRDGAYAFEGSRADLMNAPHPPPPGVPSDDPRVFEDRILRIIGL